MLAGGSGGGHGAKMLIAIDFLYTMLYINRYKMCEIKWRKSAKPTFTQLQRRTIPKCNGYSVGTPKLYSELCLKRQFLKRIKRKKLEHIVTPVHNFDHKISSEGSAKLRLAGFRDRIRSSEAAMGGGAHSAPFGVAMNPKRRVRAAHGRARAVKTH